MRKTLGFAIFEKGSSDAATAIVMTTTDRSFNYDSLCSMLNAVVHHRDMRDKYDLPMADYEVELDFMAAGGIAVARFSYTDVTRRDWVQDCVKTLRLQNPECEFVVLETAEILSNSIKASGKTPTMDEFYGPWKGVFVVETET